MNKTFGILLAGTALAVSACGEQGTQTNAEVEEPAAIFNELSTAAGGAAETIGESAEAVAEEIGEAAEVANEEIGEAVESASEQIQQLEAENEAASGEESLELPVLEMPKQ